MERGLKLAFGLLGAMLPMLAACTPSTPETELSWGVNDRSRSVASRPAKTTARTARTYTYVGPGENYAVPAPKPRPQYVAQPAPRSAYRPASYQPSTSYTGSASGTFAWPANGKVIAGFGSTASGERNDGINIAVPLGAPIRASASGTVTYSGNELKNYGNLLLIKHDSGYVTAYAHADQLLVKRGDFVSKGQVIGYAGHTGDVATPQLHFEIRHDTTPQNPNSLLASRSS